VVVSIAQALLLIPIAKLVQRAFDREIPRGHAGAVAVIALIMLGLYVASTALNLLTRWISLKVTKQAVTRLRVRLVERLLRLSRPELDRSSATELQSIVVQDSERIDQMSNTIIAVLMPAVLVAIGLSVVALVRSPLLFATVLAVVPILVVANRLFARDIGARTRRWHSAFDAFASATALGLRAMPLTKIHAAEEIEIERQARIVRELSSAGRAMSWAAGAYSIVQGSISGCAGVLVLIVGGWAASRGDMSIGELLAFYAVVALLVRQMTAIVTSVPWILTGYESVARLDRLLGGADPEPYRGTRVIDSQGELALEGVGFSYGETPVLRSLDLTIDSGERIAIVGPIGAGKSTLVSLLLGLYRPQAGRVLAGGVPFDELDVRALRRSIGCVLQDPVVFPGTIAENIAYGRPAATDAEIREAAASATADAFVETLPDGYATQVGDEGVRLSGGQRQLVAIARALFARPALVILDEPTTYLQDQVADRLMENLERLPGAPTVIVISHDPKVEAWAQRVVHLRDGTFVTERPGPDLAVAGG
jgi:ABC-type multidrug transport system fused ATPase/permease subunit